MSKIQQRSVTCGSCGKAFETSVFESINTDYAVDVPEQIVNGNLFRKKCPRCGAITNLEYDVLYHDLKHSAMIWVLQDKLPDYSEKVKEVRKTISPYKETRIVNSVAQLREKICCLENGLDDRIIELCKVFVLGNLYAQRPDFRFKQAIFRRSSGKNIITLVGDGDELSCELPQEAYCHMHDMYYSSPYSREFDGHYAVVDYPWAEKIVMQLMKKQNKEESPEDTENTEDKPVNREVIQASLREHPYASIPVFCRCVCQIFHTLSPLTICNELTEQEVVAFVLSVSAKIVGDSYYRKVIEITPEIKAFVDQRLLLYSLTLPSEVRAEWLLPKEKIDREDPYIKRWAIFGDLIVNPACENDYPHAPRMEQNFSDVIEFGTCMTGKVLDLVKVYVKSLNSGQDDSVAEAVELSALATQRKLAQNRSVQPVPQQAQKATATSAEKVNAKKQNYPVDAYNLLKQIDSEQRAQQEKKHEEQIKHQRNRKLTVLAVIIAIIGLGLCLYYTRPTDNSTPTKSWNNPLDYLFSNSSQKANATATPKPALIYNGRKFITPEYSPVCPLEIQAGSDGDYYIYLKYQSAPSYSQESRIRLAGASSPYESDVAFIVKAGQSYELDVPIGVYKLYYATGKTFFNTTILFGDTTRFYESDELLTFSASGNYYHGHTITLYEVVNGNLDTDEINERSFPTR